MNRKLAVTALLMTALTAASIFAQGFINPDKWFTYDDKNDRGTSKVSKASAFEQIDGRDVLSVTMTGEVTKKCAYGFIGIGVTPEPAELKALQGATGIKFKASGDGKKYRVKVETSDIRDYDVFGFIFEAPKGEPVELVIPYSKMTQEGWGAKKKFKRENITKIQFQTVGQPHATVELKVIDIQTIQ